MNQILIRPLLFSFCLFFNLIVFASNNNIPNSNNLRKPNLFVPNKGQIVDQNRQVRKDVLYSYSVPGFNLTINKTGMSWQLINRERLKKKNNNSKHILTRLDEHESDSIVYTTHRIDVSFINANPSPKAVEEGISSYYENWFTDYTGKEGVTNVYSFSDVTLKDVWKGIDIHFKTDPNNMNQIKYDFILRPGALINDIQLKYLGFDNKPILANAQSLIFETSLGKLTETIPSSYYKNGEPVAINYHISEDNIVTFVGNQIRDDQTLIIDPSLSWGTYLGDGFDDYSLDIALDKKSNACVTGYTYASHLGTNGAYKPIISYSYTDAYIAKISSDGSKLMWYTYYGGYYGDIANTISIDSSDNLIIAGSTRDKLATTGAYDTTYDYFTNKLDGFVAKFNSSGSKLIWGTMIGGEGYDNARDVAIDHSNNVYVVGGTDSKLDIKKVGSYDTSFNGVSDAFIVKLSADGSSLIWGTYYGGSRGDEAIGVDIDSNERVYVTGTTRSKSGIATAKAYDTIYAGNYDDAFVACFSNHGDSLVWGTYYGGDEDDDGNTIKMDRSGRVVIAGRTFSKRGIATSYSHQDSLYADLDGFIAKFNSHNGSIEWGTYYGGDGNDEIKAIAIDQTNNILITGETGSSNQIATKDAYQKKLRSTDAMVASFNSNGTLLWGTYYGGTYYDLGTGIAIDSLGNPIVTGNVYNYYNHGIATKGAYDTSYFYNIYYYFDAFVAKFDRSCSNVNAGNDTAICYGSSIKLGLPAQQGHHYLWYAYPSYNFTSTLANPTATPQITTYYYLKDSTAGGCTAYSTVTVEVYYYPSHYSFNEQICYGDSIRIGNFIGTYQGINFLWSSDPAGFSSTKNLVTVHPTVTTKYYFTQTNVIGCVTNDSFLITVLHPPQINLGPDTTICEGQAITIGASPVAGHSYDWSSDSIGFNSKVSNPIVSPSTTTKYFLTETVGNVKVCAATDSITITVNPAPAANAGLSDKICIKDSIMIGSNPVKGSSYTWSSIPSGFTSNISNPIVFPDSTITYILTETIDTTGCINSDTISITVNPIPKADFTVAYNNLIETFFPINKTYKTYAWFFGDGDSSYIITPTHKYKDNSDKQVILIVEDSNGCVGSDTQYIKILGGVSLNEKNQIALYPNPTNNKVYIAASFLTNNNNTIYIYNNTGQKVLQQEMIGSSSSVSLADFSNGLYYLVISNSDGMIYKTLVLKQ
ncbi:MAG: SBBP repeat-containing protein [Bacteroidetes bacterium]|nr:SBBP repeat-containing protein [Bacteroidota bacterium]